MNNDQKLGLLATMFALQEEAGDVFDLPTERVADIAAGDVATAEEQAILLASPLAREELLLQQHLRRLRQMEFWRERAANDNSSFWLRSAVQAAAAGPVEELALESAAGVLLVRRGPSARVPYLLTLTLNRDWWGDLQAGLRVAVREGGTEGLLWMEGVTDRNGVLRAQWPHPATLGSPATRLAALRRQLSVAMAGGGLVIGPA